MHRYQPRSFCAFIENSTRTYFPSFTVDLSTEVSSSYEKEIISREEKESEECTNKDSTIGEKFCGVKDANSDGSAFPEAEKDTKTVCYPNVPGTFVSQSSLTDLLRSD